MPSHMRIILTARVEHLGAAGDLVRVRPGYARNYLLPRSLAVPATRGQVERVEHERRAALAHASKLKQQADRLADSLREVIIEVLKPAGEAERMYGSVTAREIAQELKNRGIDIDRRKLVLPGAIKQLGEYEVGVKLAPDVASSFKLVVSRQTTRA
ncbi:MAG: 50S ribosomal protein L9 [Proteobacteria bacterium]|nr:50S ribosomal protein L9 [Pseudomonadota bacterium]